LQLFTASSRNDKRLHEEPLSVRNGSSESFAE
jgi:hypothetical protein